jgi:septal ring factor EnvC (AmiA/AmiB activator)
LSLPPVASIVREFRRPRCERCSGHRGIDYATNPGAAFGSVARGTVSFAGRVAGTVYVVVDTGFVKVTHGGLRTIDVEMGDFVSIGEAIGTADSVTYIGVRRGEWYVNPRACGLRRTRLVAEGDRDPRR